MATDQDIARLRARIARLEQLVGNPGGSTGTTGSVAAHTHTLAQASDVTITGVTDNEILAYDSGGNWINQTAAEAGLATSSHSHALDDLSDVDAAAPDDGDVLTWVDANGAWEPAAGGGGASTFTALTDTPSSYSGQGSKYVAVNAGETGLEFVAGGGVSGYHYLVEMAWDEQATGSTSSYASKGNYVTPDETIYIRGVQYQGDLSSGAQLLAKIVTYSGGTISTVVATSNTYTAGAALSDATVWLYFSADVTLSAGTTYGILFCWTNAAGGTTALVMNPGLTSICPFPARNYGYVRSAQTSPVATNSIESGGGPFSMGFMWRDANTPALS